MIQPSHALVFSTLLALSATAFAEEPAAPKNDAAQAAERAHLVLAEQTGQLVVACDLGTNEFDEGNHEVFGGWFFQVTYAHHGDNMVFGPEVNGEDTELTLSWSVEPGIQRATCQLGGAKQAPHAGHKACMDDRSPMSYEQRAAAARRLQAGEEIEVQKVLHRLGADYERVAVISKAFEKHGEGHVVSGRDRRFKPKRTKKK